MGYSILTYQYTFAFFLFPLHVHILLPVFLLTELI